MQISNFIFCDKIFENIQIQNKLLPNPYKDYPYLVIPNFFSNKLCNEITHFIKNIDDTTTKAKVKDQIINGVIKPKVNEEYRKTNIHKLSEEYATLYHKRFIEVQALIEEYFQVALTFSTDIQMLEYKEGYFYIKHADDSSEVVDEHKNTIGFINVAPQRKITTVLFMTTCIDDMSTNDFTFSGGELIFNYLYDKLNNPIKMKPKAGDMIVFPSNPYFSHEVQKVESGYRLTLVQWHDAIIK